MKIIHKSDLLPLISAEIPEVSEEVNRLSSKENIAGAIQIVVTFMKDMLQHHNLPRVRWSMMFMGWLYGRSDAAVKEIIENLFVRSFNGMKRICNPQEWQSVETKIPYSLRSVYIRQLSSL